jgi:hypothetical protein
MRKLSQSTLGHNRQVCESILSDSFVKVSLPVRYFLISIFKLIALHHTTAFSMSWMKRIHLHTRGAIALTQYRPRKCLTPRASRPQIPFAQRVMQVGSNIGWNSQYRADRIMFALLARSDRTIGRALVSSAVVLLQHPKSSNSLHTCQVLDLWHLKDD